MIKHDSVVIDSNLAKVSYVLDQHLPLILVGMLILGFILRTVGAVPSLAVIVSLTSVFVVPGYLVFETTLGKKHDWLSSVTYWLLISLAVLFIPVAMVYLFQIEIDLIAKIWLSFDIVGLLAVYAGQRTRSSPKQSRAFTKIEGIVLAWAFLMAFAVFLYGGRVTGDARNYLAWLRNVYSGDVTPTTNIRASWEAYHPLFKNIFSLLNVAYAVSAKASGVDPTLVWVIAPAFFAFFLVLGYYALTKAAFAERHIALTAAILAPLVLCKPRNRPIFDSLGDAHNCCAFVIFPILVAFTLEYVIKDRKDKFPLLPITLAGAGGAFLGIEHFPNAVYYLLYLAFLAILLLVLKRFNVKAILPLMGVAMITVLLMAPYLWVAMEIAEARSFDPAAGTQRLMTMRPQYYVQVGNQFIIHPRRILMGVVDYRVAALCLVTLLLFWKRYTDLTGGIALSASFLPPLLIGLNPFLAPVLSGLVAGQTVYRLGEMILAVPMLALLLTKALALGKRLLVPPKQEANEMFDARPGLTLGLAGLGIVLIVLSMALTGFKVLRHKVIDVLYAPTGVQKPWLNARIWGVINQELLQDPPDAFVSPPRLRPFLTGDLITFLRMNVPDNAIILSTPHTEAMLPGWTNHVPYLGSLASEVYSYHEGILSPKKIDLPPGLARLEAVTHRIGVYRTLLMVETPLSTFSQTLKENRHEIDYILVTPEISYVEPKLEQMPDVEVVYDDGTMSLYGWEK